MPFDNSVNRLLRSVARSECDENALAAIRNACDEQRHWNVVIREAESHGLAPLMDKWIGEAGADVPPQPRRQLRALSLRHDRANRVRTRALVELVDTFDAQNVGILVLKGAALAHLLYEQPGLRPMSDIDVLVPPAQLDAAARIATDLGYEDAGVHDLLADHHHLPTVSRITEGLLVSIEIHYEAIATDNIGSVRMGALSEPAREFEIDGVSAFTLGHMDMLRHLCRHALQPRKTIKIGSVLDIMLYACRFAEEIDWDRLRLRFPEVITSLQLFGYVLPLPAALHAYVPEPPQPGPGGTGVGMAPLSTLRYGSGRLSRMLRPSDWWLHAFYNVPPDRSLAFTRFVRHPLRLALWFWRRLRPHRRPGGPGTAGRYSWS